MIGKEKEEPITLPFYIPLQKLKVVIVCLIELVWTTNLETSNLLGTLHTIALGLLGHFLGGTLLGVVRYTRNPKVIVDVLGCHVILAKPIGYAVLEGDRRVVLAILLYHLLL